MLMDKFAKEQGEITVGQPHKWSEMAVNFLSSTCTSTPDVLLKHDFMQQSWSFDELRLYVSYVQMKAAMD
ncbi:hypothetical protein N0V95_010167 [Ascochyta clinopodiicola]|nr:hypothetical protein N0V95_010167 [Ascochyta clinopodiicola]